MSRSMKGEGTAARKRAPSRRPSPLIYDHSCILCPLGEGSLTTCVEGSGDVARGLMVVGEAPGRLEDARGIPFIGKAGITLNAALERAGVRREDVFVTNAVKCRPPRNRTPHGHEITVCSAAYLEAELVEVQPTKVLACGNAACDALLGYQGITELRGKWVDPQAVGMWVLPTWHPAALMYDLTKVETFYEDVFEFVNGMPE